MKSSYQEVTSFVTKDGSVIRELMHPAIHGNVQQSFAEAIVEVGAKTMLHRHQRTEEIYHFVAGVGRMVLGSDVFSVNPGDTVCISPGMPHALWNSGHEPLRLLCSCAPAYSHEDTELIPEDRF